LFGGGEERLLAFEYQHTYKFDVYTYYTAAYKHEHHWDEGLRSGQVIYHWTWKKAIEGSIMHYIGLALKNEQANS
jgi:hypothetical protein